MKQITQDDFYKIIYDKKLDVVVSVVGEYPYKHVFKFRNGTVFGFQNYDGKYYLS